MSNFTDDSSDSDGELEGLFKIRDTDDDVFYFEDMILTRNPDDGSTNVLFQFSLSKEICIESSMSINKDICDKKFDAHLFSIGMCALTWYWMGFGTKRIVIEPAVCKNFSLTPDMIQFWQTFYRNVLLEYVFLNKMTSAYITIEHNIAGVMNNNESTQLSNTTTSASSVNNGSVLLPLGGGKDSLVAWHLAQTSSQTASSQPPVLMYVADGMFEFQSSWRLQEIVKVSGSDFQLVRHNFHSETFLKHCRSYLQPCGHPWAALVLFDAVLVCGLLGISSVSLGHERSADEGNGVFVDGVEVNHQYDKSSAFLTLAGEYVRTYLSPEVRVYSALSNMWELEITRIFCQEPSLRKFHPLFMSCNEPVEGTKWCARCDKCAFMFLLLSAWLPSSYLVHTVFQGTNMLEDASLLQTFLSLIGCNGSKPFDCVGTAEEAKAAVHLTAIRYSAEWRARCLQTSEPAPASSDSECGKLSSICDQPPLPVVLCVLCERSGISTASDGSVEEQEYPEVLRRWGLTGHDN